MADVKFAQEISATNLPQERSDRYREARISADYSGPSFCGKNGPKGRFLSVIRS